MYLCIKLGLFVVIQKRVLEREGKEKEEREKH